MKAKHKFFRSRWIVFQWLSSLVVLAVQGESFSMNIYASIDAMNSARRRKNLAKSTSKWLIHRQLPTFLAPQTTYRVVIFPMSSV